MDTPSTAASDPPATTPLEVPPRARVSTLPPRGAGPPPPTPPRPPTLPPTLERVSTESPPATGPEDVAIDALAVFPGERTPVYDQEGSQDTTAPVTDRAQAVAAKNGTTTSKCCCAMPMGADRPTAQLPTVDFAGRFNVKGVPAVFQNVGCTGFSDTESVYLGGSKQGLPSLAMGFAYDFEPRAFGYPSEQLGHPTPAQCCAAMPCVSCVGQMCEPACCTEEQLNRCVALPPGLEAPAPLECRTLGSLTCVGFCERFQFLPCYSGCCRLPCVKAIFPWLDSLKCLGLCFDCTGPIEGCMECIPCVGLCWGECVHGSLPLYQSSLLPVMSARSPYVWV